MEIDARALEFWELNNQPFTLMPLRFKRPDDFDVLVKGDTIRKIKNKYDQFEKDSTYKILIVKGHRGSGKTTALRYFEHIANKNSKLTNSKVIFFPLNKGKEKEFSKLSIHKQILIRLNNSVSNDPIMKDMYLQTCEGIATLNDDIENIDFNIIILINLLSEFYERIALIFDDLDKLTLIDDYPRILDYIRSNQSFFTEIIDVKSVVYVFFALHSYLASQIEANKEFAFFGEESIEFESWKKEDLENLIKQRLSREYKQGKENFKINSFFDPDALELIYKLAEGSPREVMKICLKTMEKAFENSDSSRNKIYKPIRKHFVEQWIDEIGLEDVTNIDYSLVKSELIKHHYDAYKDIQECLRVNPIYAYEIAQSIVKYANNRGHNVLPKINILMEKYYLIEKKDKVFFLRTDVVKLISFFKFAHLKEEIIPNFLIETGM